MSLQIVSQYQEVSPEIIYKYYPEFWYCRLFGKYLNIHKRCSNFPACFSQILCKTDRTKANKALVLAAKVRKQLRGGTITGEMQRHSCQSLGKKLLLGKHTGKGRETAGKLARWCPAEAGTMSSGLGQEFFYLPISKLDRVVTFHIWGSYV